MGVQSSPNRSCGGGLSIVTDVSYAGKRSVLGRFDAFADSLRCCMEIRLRLFIDIVELHPRAWYIRPHALWSLDDDYKVQPLRRCMCERRLPRLGQIIQLSPIKGAPSRGHSVILRFITNVRIFVDVSSSRCPKVGHHPSGLPRPKTPYIFSKNIFKVPVSTPYIRRSRGPSSTIIEPMSEELPCLVRLPTVYFGNHVDTPPVQSFAKDNKRERATIPMRYGR